MTKNVRIGGGCLCGSVRYHLDGPAADIVACHCGQCRKTSGHFVAASRVPSDTLTLVEDDSLRWYRSSEDAERGFCAKCGSQLFWRAVESDHLSVMAGTMDSPDGLTLAHHIFVADKGEYYRLDDGLPQFDQGDG